MDSKQAQEQLLEIIKELAEGTYSDRIMSLTGDDAPEPIRTVAEAMALMMVKVEAREFQLEQLVDELRQLNDAIKRHTIGVMEAMAQALHTRDEYTEGHAVRVADYAHDIALKMGLSAEEAEYVRLGGMLHDIGKIGFPDDLFAHHDARLPSKLVKQVIKHPAAGAEILKELDFLGPAVDYVRCHHERLDGKGYPRNLKADQIPLGAQIIAAADVFDAVTTDRPYQKGMTYQQGLAILRKQVPNKIDARVIDAFAELIEGWIGESEQAS